MKQESPPFRRESVNDRQFRFGVVAVPEGREQWLSLARRTADLGYSTLLVPDGPQLLSSFSALALASTVEGLRVGTYVLAGPLRPPLTTAREAHSLTVLTDGRFELGIGTGRPDAREWARELDLPYGSATDRLDGIARTVDHLRQLDGDRRTPVLMAAAGAKALAVAARKADILALAAHPLAPRDEVAARLDGFRAEAGDRADEIEIAMNVFVVGDEVPPWVQGFIGADAQTLVANDSLTMLRGTTRDMADELLRRRDTLGVSYVSVNGVFLEQFAPVVEELAGR